MLDSDKPDSNIVNLISFYVIFPSLCSIFIQRRNEKINLSFSSKERQVPS